MASCHVSFLNSSFICPAPSQWNPNSTAAISYKNGNLKRRSSISVSSPRASMKIVRSPVLDKHVLRQRKTRFVEKLKTLLLSKPKHFMPLHIICRCRSYLSLPKPRSIQLMIHRYPTIFELFKIPTAPIPINATKPDFQVCVRLTPAMATLTAQESKLKSSISETLAIKLQKLLMLATHRRILLSKLVHIGPDLGMPPDFRSRICNDYPDRFKTVDTSYGRALELVAWDPDLASSLPPLREKRLDFIVDRPLKFKHLPLRKGLNLKRRHRDTLIKFRELPDLCPYNTSPKSFSKLSMEAEKRACAVVREVLGMMVEKRTLVDHLTHFRKDFELPHKLRALLVRHPELFYVSVKGQRDTVFLVEAYGDKGELMMKDDTLFFKHKLFGLVQQGRRLRRAQRNGYFDNQSNDNAIPVYKDDYTIDDGIDDECIDGFEDLFECEDFIVEDDDGGEDDDDEGGGGDEDGIERCKEDDEFWTAGTKSLFEGEFEEPLSSW